MKEEQNKVENEKSECTENEMDKSYKFIINSTFIVMGLALFGECCQCWLGYVY